MAEVVGRELGLPAGADPGLRTGHDRGVVDDEVDGASRGGEALREPADAVEVGEVEVVHLDPVDTGECLLGGLAPSGGHDDLGTGAGQRARRLQAEARVTAGDKGELSGEVDPAQDVRRGVPGSEP